MMRKSQDEESRALHSSRTIMAIIFVATLVAIALWRTKGYVALWQWYLAAGTAGLFLLFLLTTKKVSTLVSGGLSLVCAVVVLFASLLSNIQAARAGLQYEAFAGFKLTAMIFAIVAPRPAWVAYLVIAFCGIGPVGLYFAYPEFQQSVAVQEPWLTVLFSMIGFALLSFRRRSIELEQSLARIQAKDVALMHIARAVLALRDLSNTPLQTLTAATALLHGEQVPRAEIARLCELALERLKGLHKVLESYEHKIDWTQLDGSFDGMTVLKELQNPPHPRATR